MLLFHKCQLNWHCVVAHRFINLPKLWAIFTFKLESDEDLEMVWSCKHSGINACCRPLPVIFPTLMPCSCCLPSAPAGSLKMILLVVNWKYNESVSIVMSLIKQWDFIIRTMEIQCDVTTVTSSEGGNLKGISYVIGEQTGSWLSYATGHYLLVGEGVIYIFIL